jgi:hypothetical protein
MAIEIDALQVGEADGPSYPGLEKFRGGLEEIYLGGREAGDVVVEAIDLLNLQFARPWLHRPILQIV